MMYAYNYAVKFLNFGFVEVLLGQFHCSDHNKSICHMCIYVVHKFDYLCFDRLTILSHSDSQAA